MADQTTTTTSTSTSGGIADMGFLKTIHGILKLAELLLNIITLICVAVWYWHPAHQFALFVICVCFILSLVVYVFFLFRVVEKLALPWLLIDLIYHAGGALLYFIAACVLAAFAGGWSNLIAGTVFAFITAICYGVSVFFTFQAWRGAGGSTDSPTKA